MQKVIVIGCPGSGKSTFARWLGEKTGLPLYHLDMIYHKPDRTTVSREEFDSRLQEIIDTDRWIIDGNYQRTLRVRLDACDTVFLLDFPLDVCLAGVQSRIGKPRADMPWVETEFDEEFRQWIMGFGEKQLPEIYRLLDEFNGKNIVIFKTRGEIEKFLEWRTV